MNPKNQEELPFGDPVSVGDSTPQGSTGVTDISATNTRSSSRNEGKGGPSPLKGTRIRASESDTTTSSDDDTSVNQPKLVVRVLPDIVALDKTFDYAVPDHWHRDGRAEKLIVGSIVRVDFNGRRVRGWVTEVDVTPPGGITLQPLQHLTGIGPPEELIDLAFWAAWRWAGRRVTLLRSASPMTVVSATGIDTAAVSGYSPKNPRYRDDLFTTSTAGVNVTVLRSAPCDDGVAISLAATRRGDALILVPNIALAGRITSALRSAGVRVAFGSHAWRQALAGATVVGTRKAVWMPMPSLAAVVVFDEHEEDFQERYSVTWNARDVALERARRRGVPTVLVSPIPSLEAIAQASSQIDRDIAATGGVEDVTGAIAQASSQIDRDIDSCDVVAAVGNNEDEDVRATGDACESRDGWPLTVVLDRRREDPVRGGLFAEGFKSFLDPDTYKGRVAVILNRKGRSRLLACKSCGEIVRSADGLSPMIQIEDELVSRDGSERRPAICFLCGSTVLRNLRIGLTRAHEELAALAREPVGHLTSESASIPPERIVIGTEAVLRRMRTAVVVVFLDFDQELLASRQRASSQALKLLMLAARLLGSKTDFAESTSGVSRSAKRRFDGRRLVIQTRQPNHPVVRSAVRADPSISRRIEYDRRKTLGLPPFSAQVRISGPGAESFVTLLSNSVTVTASSAGESVTSDDGVVIRGPLKGRYLLRSARRRPLLDALARTPRPSQRVRIEVDPLRI